jgi:hypothetical protein
VVDGLIALVVVGVAVAVAVGLIVDRERSGDI